MPHPDDCEIRGGGHATAAQGAGISRFYIATMTPGDKGSRRTTGRKPRSRLCRRAGSAAGASRRTGGGESATTVWSSADLEIPYREHVAAASGDTCSRRVDAGVLFTTPPVDYMADHEITSRLVRDACFNAAVPNYETEARRASDHPGIRRSTTDRRDRRARPVRRTGAGTVSGRHLGADGAARLTALACHDSQREWLAPHNMAWMSISMRCRWGAQTRGASPEGAYA